MSFSYDPALDTDLDKVRNLLNDTVEASAVVTDEQINWWLSISSGPFEAARVGVQYLITTYSTRPDWRAGPLSINWSSLTKGWLTLAAWLDQMALGQGVLPIPYAGGIDAFDKENRRADTSLVTPFFRREDIPEWIDEELLP